MNAPVLGDEAFNVKGVCPNVFVIAEKSEITGTALLTVKVRVTLVAGLKVAFPP